MATAPVRGRLQALPSLDVQNPYPMNREHLGHAVVLNNLRSEFPQTAVDAEAVASALETTGFMVKQYDNCNVEKMRSIKDTVTTESRHVATNCLFLVIFCHKIKHGWLLDRYQRRAYTIEQLASSISKVRTLRRKPKVLLIQEAKNGSEDDGEEIPIQRDKKDFYIVCATCDSGSESRPSYLQEFARHLQGHHMKESLSTILLMTKESLQTAVKIPSALKDKDLMVLAGKISTEAMRIIAVQKLDIEYDQVKTLSDANRENQHIMKFEILRKWKNMNQGVTRQKLAAILRDTDGIVDSLMVDKVLQTGETREQGIKQFDSFKHALYISEFYKKSAVSESQIAESEDPEIHPVIAAQLQELQERMAELSREKMAQETRRPVTLTMISSHDTHLEAWSCYSVMPSTGQIEVYGRAKKLISEADYYLHMYTPTGNSFKHTTINPVCGHLYVTGLLGVQVEGRELLAVSCDLCEDIKLLNLHTQKLTTAYSENKVGCLCHGDTNRLYVKVGFNEVMELNTSSSKFSLVKTINTGMAGSAGMCYVPAPHRCLVVSGGGTIRAVSCETGERVFDVSGKVDGREINPYGLLFSPQHGSVLVADGTNGRILVLDPCNGEHLQSINLLGLERLVGLCLYSDRVIIWHCIDDSDKYKFSILSIK